MNMNPPSLVPAPPSHQDWNRYAAQSLRGEPLSRTEARSILQSDDDELLALMHAAFTVRRHYYGKKVKLNMLINAKSGHCPEDCGYCSQSKVAKTTIDRYPMVDRETIIAGARQALATNAGTYCIVCSGRGPTPKDLENIAAAVREIKETMPLKICACLGILKNGQAELLKSAGVDRYNHNINTSADHFAAITSTHTYQQRVDTLLKIKAAGISPCSGVIVGMGETDEQIIDMALALKELDADSIPVNFLHPIPGTPLEQRHELNPRRCLKVLALFRFICPTKEIRASGGREFNLRSLQCLALYAANSIFIGDYLTTDGQAAAEDHKMIADIGFEIEHCAL